MTSFDATTATINANDISGTRLPRFASSARTEGTLRDAFEEDDRQVLASSAMLNSQFEHGAGLSANEGVRSGARGWLDRC